MKIFVIGKLGEIVKKVIELEWLISDNPTNTLLIAEFTAYQQVLQMWPVTDKKELEQQVDIFKFCIANLRERETALREQNSVALYDVIAKNNYLKALDETRACMANISELGQYSGTSPLLEVEDAIPVTDTK